jgi:hypothetical protein
MEELTQHELLKYNMNIKAMEKLSNVDPTAKKYNPDIFKIKWNNKLAVQRVHETAEILNRDPDYLDENPGGFAKWVKPGTFYVGSNSLYEHLIIKDVGYYHEKPAEHLDFYFLSMRYHIKPDKLSNLHKITGSAYYYQIGGILYAGCHFPGASIITFGIIKEYNEDKISLEDAREFYNGRIARAMEEYTKAANSGNIGNSENWKFISTYEGYVNGSL